MVPKETILNDIKELIQILKNNGISVFKTFLFGSYAKNTQREGSDIDVAIISENFTGIRFADMETIIPFLTQINPYIEVHPFSKEDYDKDSDWFVEEIKKTGTEISS